MDGSYYLCTGSNGVIIHENHDKAMYCNLYLRDFTCMKFDTFGKRKHRPSTHGDHYA